jgi:predicted metal-dependent peptidase
MNIKPNDLDVWAQAMIVLDGVVPYLGPALQRLVPVPTNGLGDAICCDRQSRVFFDPAYAARVGVAVLAADVLHEVLHPVSAHFERAEELGIVTPEALREWNVAADKALNGQVFAIAARNGMAIQPGGILFASDRDLDAIRACKWLSPLIDGQPDGLLAEEYWALDKQQQKQQQQQQQGGGSGSQQPQQGQQQPQQGQGQGQGGAGQQQGSPSPSGPGKGACGSVVGSGAQPDDLTAKAHALATAQHGSLPNGGPSDEELKSIRVEVAERVEAHEATHGRGSVPEGLVRVCSVNRRPPAIDWRKRLAAALRKGLSSARGASDYAMTRPKWREGVGTPRLMAPQGRVAVIADTSGSMEEGDLNRVLNETAGILRSGSVEQLWWIPTDSRACKPRRIRDLRQAHLVGGGGTEMGAGLRAAGTIRPGVHLTIVITDGDTDWPAAKPDGVGSVLIVRTRDSSCRTPKWATVCDAFQK